MEESNNCPHLKVEVHVNADKAREVAETLKDAENVDTEYALVVVLPVEEGSEDKVKASLDNCMTNEEYNGGMCRDLRRAVKRGDLVYKSTVCNEHHKVVLSFAPPE